MARLTHTTHLPTLSLSLARSLPPLWLFLLLLSPLLPSSTHSLCASIFRTDTFSTSFSFIALLRCISHSSPPPPPPPKRLTTTTTHKKLLFVCINWNFAGHGLAIVVAQCSQAHPYCKLCMYVRPNLDTIILKWTLRLRGAPKHSTVTPLALASPLRPQ